MSEKETSSVFAPACLDGKTVLVTGGSGSFGNAFVRTVLSHYRPRRLIVFSRDEMKQHEMARTIAREELDPTGCLRFFIGDVRDRNRLELAMRDVEIVIHAAAMKIVPAAEYNPFECILTNIHGAENVVKAALASGVERVVSLSTDKAVSPINLYGASKLAADKIMVAANNLAGDRGTRFSVVRYGNVVGSRGSIIPFFQERIRLGDKSLPITDPEMTRFWITLGQGVDFVLSSLAAMEGGEIFIPKIPSMRIVDLARALGPSLDHEIVGVRPGEKLHEVMITEDDARTTVELPDRYIICPPTADYGPKRLRCLGEKLRAIGATPVADRFRYSSNENERWLDAKALRAMLDGGEAGSALAARAAAAPDA